MSDNEPSVELYQAINQYLLSLDPSKANDAGLTLKLFARWLGVKRTLASLQPAEIARYSQSFPQTDTELEQKLETLRSFFVYAKKQGLTKINMATHVKLRKSKTVCNKAKTLAAPVVLTLEGHATLTQELQSLKDKRPQIVQAVRMAAADKDFRENSPLAAAKEELGHVDGRIHELEETLKVATINNVHDRTSRRICLGDKVTLRDKNGEILKCVIVSTREASASNGKISDSSPLGRAIMGKLKGDEVEISAPAGRICYVVESVDKR